MRHVQKWVVRLSPPVIVGTEIDGIERHEVIDTLILQLNEGGSVGDTAEEVVRIWKAIDWHRSDPIAMEEFECCDLTGAVIQAQADARRRAEIYCEAASQYEGRTLDGTHRTTRARVRLVASQDDAA